MIDPEQCLISVDDHLIEPPDLWVSRLSEKDREAGPRIIEKADGQQRWLYEGDEFPNIGLGAIAGRKFEDFSNDPVRFDEMLPGCYRVKDRLADMDLDGVHASLCFPSFSRFCGQTFLAARDKDLALRCVQAYNDFVIDEWGGESGGRLLPMVIVPLWDPVLAADELRKSVARGAVAATFTENPSALGLPSFYSDHWDPLFAAAQEADVPLCMHIGSGSKQIDSDAPDAKFSTRCALIGLNSMLALTDLLLSPTFDRFPDLKVTLSEGGAGWVPYLLERADYTWVRYRTMDNLSERQPSEMFRKNVWVCMIDDEIGVKVRHEIGVDRIMWECDYPHGDTSWPQSRKRVEEMLADVPADEAAAIVEGNARQLFRLSSA